jgi:hypothetical protein
VAELGLTWVSPRPEPPGSELVSGVNTRTALWPERWPAIALQSCIDEVESAPVEEQSAVKFDLPCKACPENTRCLNAKRKELGPLMYDREILTKPRSAESTLFPFESFSPMLMRDESLVPHWRKTFGVEEQYRCVQAWDLAWSEKTGGDWLVCMTAQVHVPSGVRSLLDVQRWQRLSFGRQCLEIEAKHALFASDLVVIEGDAAQRIWAQHLSATTAVPVVRHESGDKQSLMHGVPGLLLLLENRKWRFPYAPGYHREEVDVFLGEMEAFGWNDGKLEGVGEHDDTVMCFWHLNWGIDLVLGAGIGETRRGVVSGAHG